MLNLAKSGNAAMPIPSQPMQECSGGVTTRSWSPERTVKTHECGSVNDAIDSLSCAETNAQKHGIKSLRDNITDYDSKSKWRDSRQRFKQQCVAYAAEATWQQQAVFGWKCDSSRTLILLEHQRDVLQRVNSLAPFICCACHKQWAIHKKHLPQVACRAERLGIPFNVLSAATRWNDVIENQIFCAFAPNACRVLPHLFLKLIENTPIPVRHAAQFGLSGVGNFKHAFSVLDPELFHHRAAFLSVFWARAPIMRLRMPGLRSSAFGFSNSQQRSWVMIMTPKRIIFSRKSCVLAFRFKTCNSFITTSQIICGTVNRRAAYTARYFSSCSWRRHKKVNGVKSVEHPLYHNEQCRSIPSQARQEWRDGVTTRAWSPERTVKPHERPARKGRYSLSCRATYRSADKEPRDNTTDQTLAINPQDVISAASFDIKQAACAVTVSGLEQIQNS